MVHRVVIVTKVVVMIQQQVIKVRCRVVLVRVQNQKSKDIDLVVIQIDPDHGHMNHEKTNGVNISNNHIAGRIVVIVDIVEVENGVENEVEDDEANRTNIDDTMIDQKN